MAENATLRLESNLERLHDSQAKIASGKQYSKASEEPSKASRALQLRSTLSANENYITAAERADLWISTNELGLHDLIESGKRAIGLGNSALSDTVGQAERKAVRDELMGLIPQIVNLGNSAHQGKYIFNGYDINATTKPFDVDMTQISDPNYNPITPHDSGQDIILRYGPGQTITLNYSGEDNIAPFLDAVIRTFRALDAESQGNPFDKPELLAAIGDLNDTVNSMSGAYTTNGAAQREIRNGINLLGRVNIEIKALLSYNEDINLAEASSTLQQRELAYQASLAAASKALQTPSLFDYIG